MKRLLIALLLLSAPAFAQQQPRPPSAEEQALGGKLMEEINANIQLRTELLKAQAQAKSLQEENMKLRAASKVEAKPPEPPKAPK